MRDSDINLLVNELTTIARDHGQSPSLRKLIAEALHQALSEPDEQQPAGSDQEERQRFAQFMEGQGFGREAVAPPPAPMKHYRSSHVETCWEAWVGCLKAHNF